MYCKKCEQKKKSVTLIFKREEILYDVQNNTYIETDVSETTNEHVKHQMRDVAQFGNVDRVTRVLNLAYQESLEMLYPYTKTEIEDEQKPINNILTEPQEYVFELTLPETFSSTTLLYIKELLHNYFVYRVLADWTSIVNPPAQPKWEEKKEETRYKIKTALVSRLKALRRKLKPF